MFKKRIAKYFYNSITVYKFCKIEFLNYKNVTRSIRYFVKKYENDEKSLSYIIEKVINKYIDLRNKKQEYNAVIETINNKINISKLCKELSISIKSAYNVIANGFSKKNSIIMIYFLYDKCFKNKSISINTIKNIQAEIYTKKYTYDLRHLFCYYFMDIEIDSMINSIYFYCEHIYEKAYKKAAHELGIKIKEYNIFDFKNEMFLTLKYMLLNFKIIKDSEELLERKIYSVSLSKAFSYVKSIKDNFYLKSLDDDIFKNKTLYDLIPS